MKKNIKILVTIAAILVALAAGFMYGKKLNANYWAGYNEGYNTGKTDGWAGCIEENNLYKRYEGEGAKYEEF